MTLCKFCNFSNKPIVGCSECIKMNCPKPDWFRPGQRVKRINNRNGSLDTVGTITNEQPWESRADREERYYVYWDDEFGNRGASRTHGPVSYWIDHIAPIYDEDIAQHLNTTPQVETETCPDCKGTGEYRGFTKIEPCKTCIN